jgi:hypothetical protein
MSAQITDFQHAHRFILAGNATFTLVSGKTGTRFTYKVRANDEGDVHFVSLLTGPANTDDFTYMGIIRNNEFRRTAKSRVGETAPSFIAFQWFWAYMVQKGRLPVLVGLWHEGRCGRCGRVLTVPESIETGLGPECSSKMGVHRVTPSELEAIIAERRAGVHPDEVAMARMEAEGDRLQTIRDERNKHRARARMEGRR